MPQLCLWFQILFRVGVPDCIDTLNGGSYLSFQESTMCIGTYSLNVNALVGGTIWMMAAMSTTWTVACVAGMAWPIGTWIHLRMSDLVSALGEFRSDRAGGSRWFSNLKNRILAYPRLDGIEEKGRVVWWAWYCVSVSRLCFPSFGNQVGWRMWTCFFLMPWMYILSVILLFLSPFILYMYLFIIII